MCIHIASIFFLFLLDIVPFSPLILSILVCDSFFFFRSRSLIPAYVFNYLYFTHFYENMSRSSFQAFPPSSQQHRTSNFSFIFSDDFHFKIWKNCFINFQIYAISNNTLPSFEAFDCSRDSPKDAQQNSNKIAPKIYLILILVFL